MSNKNGQISIWNLSKRASVYPHLELDQKPQSQEEMRSLCNKLKSELPNLDIHIYPQSSYCSEINVLNGYNARIPAFLMERFNSFWFSTYIKKLNYLSYARLGNTMLSNSINKFVNPMKLPFTLRMYPTLHKY